ncbi:10756_t:CDS:2, partial [Diversispora eburnea]
YRRGQKDFAFNFRLEARKLYKCLEYLVEHGSDSEKQKAQELLNVFEASIFFFNFILITTGRQYGGPIKKVYFHDYGGRLRPAHFMPSRCGLQAWLYMVSLVEDKNGNRLCISCRTIETSFQTSVSYGMNECLGKQYTNEKKRLQLDQVKVARAMAQGTEDGVRNILKNVNAELEKEEPIAHAIQPKKLKRKYDADEENLGINESSDNINIESTELEPNDEINTAVDEILDLDPLSNVKSDISEIESDSGLSTVRKYPDKDSPDNVWILPSRKSIDKVIRGPKNLHKSHLSCLSIIRIGPKVRKPEWIVQADWDYLNLSIEYPHYDLSKEIENLFVELLETSAFHSINKNEVLLGSLIIHPVLQYLVNATDHVIYVPGEIHLKASANQRLLRRNLKPDDDKSLGMK